MSTLRQAEFQEQPPLAPCDQRLEHTLLHPVARTSARRMALGIALTILGGCTYTRATRLPNPLRTGFVQANRIVLTQGSEERRYGLAPGSLNHTASLSALDAQKVCFDVTFQAVETPSCIVDPTRKSWRLTAEPGAWTLQKPQVQRFPKQRRSQPGFITKTVQRKRRSCDAEGKNCRDRVVREQQRQATQLTVLQGGGRICFNHAGRISPHTQSVTLRYGILAGWRQFRWSF